jgi:hypothetical protein
MAMTIKTRHKMKEVTEIESQVCSVGGSSDCAETSNHETPIRIVVTSRFLAREKDHRGGDMNQQTRAQHMSTRWEDLWWWVYSTSPMHF